MYILFRKNWSFTWCSCPNKINFMGITAKWENLRTQLISTVIQLFVEVNEDQYYTGNAWHQQAGVFLWRNKVLLHLVLGDAAPFFGMLDFSLGPRTYLWMKDVQRDIPHNIQCRYNCPLLNFTNSVHCVRQRVLVTLVPHISYATQQISAAVVTRTLDLLLLLSLCRNQVSMGTTGDHLPSHSWPGPLICCSESCWDEAWDLWDWPNCTWHRVSHWPIK